MATPRDRTATKAGPGDGAGSDTATVLPPATPHQGLDKGTGAIRVKPPALLEEFGQPTRRYWIGTIPGCPVQNIHVAGFEFPWFRGTPSFDSHGNPEGPLQLGAEIDLTEKQVGYIVESVRRKVLRPLRGGRAKMLTTDGKSYRAQDGDLSAGRFLYMHDLTASEGRRPLEPTPMME